MVVGAGPDVEVVVVVFDTLSVALSFVRLFSLKVVLATFSSVTIIYLHHHVSLAPAWCVAISFGRAGRFLFNFTGT